LLLVIAGVFLSSVAGRLRERDAPVQTEVAGGVYFGLDRVICLFSGVFSAMLNFSFELGKELRDSSLDSGPRPTMASNLI